MAGRRGLFWDWIVSMVSIGFCRLTAAFPLPVARAIGKALGALSYYAAPRVRRISLANLDLAFGDSVSPREKRRIARQAASNIGIVAAEFARIRQLRGEFLRQQVVLKGLERLDAKRGILLIGGHIGNWEWMGSVLTGHGFPFVGVVRPLDAPRLNAFVDTTRRANGVITLPKEGAGREVVRLLQEGCVVGILIDQSPREAGVPVRFFGHPCWGTIAPMVTAVRAGSPIHVASMVRQSDGTYVMEFSPAVEMVRTDDLLGDFEVNCQRCQDAVEAVVRRHPEQWLWAHRRWKARARLEAEWADRCARRGASRASDGTSA